MAAAVMAMKENAEQPLKLKLIPARLVQSEPKARANSFAVIEG